MIDISICMHDAAYARQIFRSRNKAKLGLTAVVTLEPQHEDAMAGLTDTV